MCRQNGFQAGDFVCCVASCSCVVGQSDGYDRKFVFVEAFAEPISQRVVAIFLVEEKEDGGFGFSAGF